MPSFSRGASPGWAWRAIALSFAGSAALALADGGGRGALYGDLLALAAAVFVSLYTLIGRVQRDHLSTTVYTFLTYSACLLTLLVLDWATLTPVVGYGWKEVLIGLGLAVACTLLGHSLFSYSLKYLSPSYVSAAKLCEPIFASLLGIPLFGEIPGGVQVFGSVLVLAGVLLYTRAEA